MKTSFFRFTVFFLAPFFILTLFFPGVSKAQSRDYLTDEEIELVRNSQEIDKRIDVLIKAIDRRMAVLTNQNWQPSKKEADKWGELPSGSKSELLWDISRILQKAIDDIDDLVSRQGIDDKVLGSDRKDELDDETSRIIKTNKKNFAAAVHNLADASQRYLPTLENLLKTTTDKKEQGLIYGATESCNMIIEASAKVDKPESDKKKKNKGN